MNYSSVLLFLTITMAASAQRNEGNPHYDFPEQIIKKNGTIFGYLNGNMADLATSGYAYESILYEDSFAGPAVPVRISLNNQRLLDAREFILKEAAKYRILLINEGHNRPEHRLFTKSLLAGLHVIGYNVFMAEGINLKNDIAARNYPVSTEGYFMSEPVYASLIRYAGRIGYSVNAYEYDAGKQGKKYWDDSIKLDKYGSIKYISYEPRDSAVLLFDEKGLKLSIFTNVREKAQAQNIMKVIREHPTSKFIIHVGYGHLYESGSMMGAQLRTLLKGEDVLTIDQATLNNRIPLIDTVTRDTVRQTFPFILQNANTGKFFNSGIAVDYMVFNKIAGDSLMRPKYLFDDVEKRTVFYPPVNELKDCPCLFSAYYQNEYKKEGEHTIAVDVAYTKNFHQPAPLLLYKGKYIIIRKNKDGLFSHFSHTVK